MVDRVWDSDGKYPEAVLKEYEYWVVEVSYRQHTLGSYIIFAKREVEKISELEDKEIVELKRVMGRIEEALFATPEFVPDRFNYWQMGNNLHHLHFHGIPRYAKPRKFAGREWVDKTWGSVPVWSRVEVDREMVQTLREAIGPALKEE